MHLPQAAYSLVPDINYVDRGGEGASEVLPLPKKKGGGGGGGDV